LPTEVAMTSRILFSFFITVCLILPPFAAIAKTTYQDPVTGIEFVLIPGGTFIMGDVHNKGYDIERPKHKVSLSEFYMSTTEITFAQYDIFCETTNRAKPDDNGWGRGNRPVVNVSWTDAVEFSIWLSEQTGKRIRPPSEAQWEYAALGGRNTEYWWGDQAGQNNANCRNCGSKWSGKMPAPVGSFAANPYGLFDMHGNVYEWCFDARHDTYEGAPDDGSPWFGQHTTEEKIIRSGSYLYNAFESRARARSWDATDSRNRDYGIRLVMEP